MSKKILKRSLALGALMAFVITGNVWAAGADSTKEGYEEIETHKSFTASSITKVLENKKFMNITYTSTNGGAITMSEGSDLSIVDCTFIDNTAKSRIRGGHISNTKGTLTIKNSHFYDSIKTGNSTPYGDAIYASGGTTNIYDSVFENAKGANGVIYIRDNAELNLYDNHFKNNSASSVHLPSEGKNANVYLYGNNKFENNASNAIFSYGNITFTESSNTVMEGNAEDITTTTSGNVFVNSGAVVESHSGIDSAGGFELNGTLKAASYVELEKLSGTNGTFEFLKEGINVEVTENTSTGLKFVANGTVNDAVNGNIEELIGDKFDANDSGATFELKRGSIVGDVTGKLIKGEDGKYQLDASTLDEKPHEGNAAISHNANIAMMAWRAETNDMNKRLGELRNANGDFGVWVRMVGGEDEFKSVEYDYTQYQLGYDEKLSVDPSWTVGVALSYTDGESNFTDGSGENTHKGLSVYGSKLNDDGSFIDLIAKYSRLEHDLTSNGDKGDYSTNGYSVSAEYGKRFQQGKGLWIEPQVELTYGKVKSAEYQLGDKTVSQDAMESLVGRVGFSLGKDISKGNVYARASYLYDFEGETNMAFANSGARREFKYDLGGGWWEVGVGANINLSKATYIYADIEKTFGGEVDTNWQWNLGVRYSF